MGFGFGRHWLIWHGVSCLLRLDYDYFPWTGRKATAPRPRACTLCRECVLGEGWDEMVALRRKRDHFICEFACLIINVFYNIEITVFPANSVAQFTLPWVNFLPFCEVFSFSLLSELKNYLWLTWDIYIWSLRQHNLSSQWAEELFMAYLRYLHLKLATTQYYLAFPAIPVLGHCMFWDKNSF